MKRLAKDPILDALWRVEDAIRCGAPNRLVDRLEEILDDIKMRSLQRIHETSDQRAARFLQEIKDAGLDVDQKHIDYYKERSSV